MAATDANLKELLTEISGKLDTLIAEIRAVKGSDQDEVYDVHGKKYTGQEINKIQQKAMMKERIDSLRSRGLI